MMISNYKTTSSGNSHEIRERIIEESDENTKDNSTILFDQSFLDDFREEIQNITDNIDVNLVEKFKLIYSTNNNVPIDFVVNSNFPLSMFNILRTLIDGNIEDPNIILLLSAFDIFFSKITENLELFEGIIPVLIYILFHLNNDNIELIYYSLSCLQYFSSKNLLNRLLIRTYQQENEIQGTHLIKILWDLFLSHFMSEKPQARTVARKILQIYSTFETNTEEEMINLIVEKFLSLLSNDSEFYSFPSLEILLKFTQSNLHLKIILKNGGAQILQSLLLKSVLKSKDWKDEFGIFINNLLNLSFINEEIKSKLLQFRSELQNHQIDLNIFIDFLENEAIEYNHYDFGNILNNINKITSIQSYILEILDSFIINSMSPSINSKIMLDSIKTFEFSLNNNLLFNTIQFIHHCISSHQQFSSDFLSRPENLQFLSNTISSSTFNVKCEIGILFVQIIRNANRDYINQMVNFGLVNHLIDILVEFQDADLIYNVILMLCKILDFGFGPLIINNLREIQDYLTSISLENENQKLRNLMKLLLRKMHSIPIITQAE
ncbi:hypothetical protein TRFO_06595 [Tritrichomonas foetus]|uniref:Uncharacterized protein n=1 Tax=Tritrichomonas foetus TaxID=1144522 RepID=A0A1J4JZ38_9EUKA|nr:hypothetical protein TRFO_06595 [Tritrichomonas foetus]|eukprot:OHT03752.1 hypothetical protein TRFO_06595 [Tritrichomonas foetus]